jgi:hypothetical protein
MDYTAKNIFTNKYSYLARVFVHGRSFQPGLKFVGTARSPPKSGAPERYAKASHANIVLGWKDLPGTNTLT